MTDSKCAILDSGRAGADPAIIHVAALKHRPNSYWSRPRHNGHNNTTIAILDSTRYADHTEYNG